MADMKVTITLDATELRKQLGLTEAELKKVDGKQISVKTDTAKNSVNKLTDSFASMALASVAAAVSIGKVIQTMGQAIQGAREATIAQRLLQSQLAATGNAAGISADNLSLISEELQSISNMDDDAIIQNLTVPLTTFRKLSGDVFERTQKAVLDMNAVLGDPNNPGSLRSMAVQVGKALNDPLIGLTALRRVGVSFSASQIEIIKNLVETNRLTEAQTMILSELETEFGGAAESTVNSSIQMKNAWGNYLEALGKNTLPYLDGVNLAFANFFTVMTGNMSAYVDNQQSMMVANFRSMNDFAAGLALNTETVVRLIWGTITAVTEGIDALFRIAGNSMIGWAKTAWAIVDKLPTAIIEAIGMGNMDAIKTFATGVKNNFNPIMSETKTSLIVIGDQLKYAISGFREYEKNFSTITDQSLKTYNKTLELRKSLGNIAPDDSGNTGPGGGSASGAEVTETAKAYTALLDNLRQYHSETALVNLDAHQKAMAKLAAQFEEEQRIILASMEAKEITTAEGEARLREIRGKYDAEILEERKKADDEIMALAQKRIEQATKDETSYYEAMRFADSGYYSWKKAQITAEVNAMNIGEQQKNDLVKQRLDELKALKAEADQAALKTPGHWFFTGILGFDPAKDQKKIEEVKSTIRGLQSNVASSISGLISMSEQRKQKDLAAIDEVAAKQNLSDTEVQRRKSAINKKYEAEQKRMGNIQKAASIAQTIIHTREAAMASFKALAGIPLIGPALGAAASAAAIAAGAIQIAAIKAQKFAGGGLFQGQGGDKDDKNLVLLSNNEYVVNAAATRRFLPLLNAINGSQSMPTLPRIAYAEGGLVAGSNGLSKIVEGLGRKLDALNANVAALELSVSVVNKAPNVTSVVERQEFAKQKMQALGKEYTYAL